MQSSHTVPARAVPDVSVIVPFADDEDWIGAAIQRISDHLDQLGLTHEILAVDEDSGDNSHALLTLLGGKLPALDIIAAAQPGQGFSIGAERARGAVLWLVEPANAVRSLAAFARGHGRVARGELDVCVVRGRFSVVKRGRCLGLVESVRGRGVAFERRLAKRATRRGHTVEAYALGGRKYSERLGERLRGRLRLGFSLGH